MLSGITQQKIGGIYVKSIQNLLSDFFFFVSGITQQNWEI
jgi:hypothetical protein